MPAGSQAVDPVVWLISGLGLDWLPIPHFGSVRGGSQPLIWLRAHPGAFCLCTQAAGAYQGARPPGVLGVGPRPLTGVRTHWGTLGLAPRQLGHLSGRTLPWGFSCGPQATDWGTHPLGHFGSGAQTARPLIRAPAHSEFQLWARCLLVWVCTSWASGECWGCLSQVHRPGAEGGRVPDAAAAEESSLTSC